MRKWIFNKENTKVLLVKFTVKMTNDFQMIDNNYFGYFNFSQSFILSISEKDFERIKSQITNSKNCITKEEYNFDKPPTASPELLDTLIYENNNFYGISYFSKGLNSSRLTYHSLQLRKQTSGSYWYDKGKYILHYWETNNKK